MVVYQVPCSCGWVGIHWEDHPATGVQIKPKKKDACSQGQLEKSTIAEHAWGHDHPVERSATQIVDHTSKHKELLVKKTQHSWAVADICSQDPLRLCNKRWVNAFTACLFDTSSA